MKRSQHFARCGTGAVRRRTEQTSWRRQPTNTQYLKELCSKSPESIIIELSNAGTDVSEWIRGDEMADKIYFVIAIFAKILPSPFNVRKGAILSKMCKGRFVKELTPFLVLLPSQSASERQASKFFWENIDTFWKNLFVFCSSLLDVIPTNARDIVPKLVSISQLTIANLEQERALTFRDEVKKQLASLQEKLQMCIDEMKGKVESLEPPDDFRQISIYPTSEEIIGSASPFLRKNKLEGSYRDVGEYLDVQFRLLREDFVKPLKEGIREYILQQHGERAKKRILSVKVYRNVRFAEIAYVRGEVGRKVQLERHVLDRYNSKRLMYGSLLCFTKDGFDNLQFGRIIYKDDELLKQGQIIVSLDGAGVKTGSDKYVMVECSIYFEPYYVVLKALKQLKTDTFPLKRYIIEVNKQINQPRYLDESSTYKIDGRSCRILNSQWSDEEYFQLNQMQFVAFKTALSKELVIIQGPPGTGKTHLGLKIVKTLLANSMCRGEEEEHTNAILVLCYTNHALDQFLTGLLKFTRRIVRVGGQSKSGALEPYNLHEWRRNYSLTNHWSQVRSAKQELIEIIIKIKEFNSLLDAIKNCECVIDFQEFEVIEPDWGLSWFSRKDAEEIERWLTGKVNKRRYIDEHESDAQTQDQYSVGYEEFLPPAEIHSVQEENRIEIHGDFNTTGHEIQLRLTCDLKKMQEDLNFLRLKVAENQVRISVAARTEDRKVIRALEMTADELEENINYIRLRLIEGKKLKNPTKPENLDLKKPHKLSASNRWRLYFYWLDLYKSWVGEQLDLLEDTYLKKLKNYEELQIFEDLEFLRTMDVVGITTTGGARLQSVLQALKCRIVVVEEAAEILESHIVTSVTADCQHLILIGDHQQLRPTTADYSIEKNMNLGISLFERFIMNKLEYSRLNIQHRMRPEISSLISPAIYPDLVDHPSVSNYPPMRGMDKSVYFIHHSEEEVAFGDSSKKNPHEAKFLVRLAQHLLFNGYAREEITILVAYLGQYYSVREEQRRVNQDGVRCAVLDNYQGEESKIVLLSLVRNNKENSIGFLKIENRVCVALSRAKEGLYIMGNMELLCRNSEIWPKVKSVLVAQNSLGENLVLRCQIHRDRTVDVKYATDFDRVPNGCCDQKCAADLKCGHTCVRFCHIDDKNHQYYECRKLCGKVLCQDQTHTCKKFCYKTCDPCRYEIEVTLPCGHTNKMLCFMNNESYKCHISTQTELRCGHVVKKPCYQEANAVVCTFPCDKRLERCGHACVLKCHVDDDPEHEIYVCKQSCPKDATNCSLEGQKHACQRLCCEICEVCRVKVEKVSSICGHTVACECYSEHFQELCTAKCEKTLTCGHSCRNFCGESCTSRCEEMVDMTSIAACQHKPKIPCYMLSTVKSDDPVLFKFCTAKCETVLACGHVCSGTCLECNQGRVHKACTAPCERFLICGHKCSLPCGKLCEPCTQKCLFKCAHRECNKICGHPCWRCNKKCPRVCKHAKCSSKCTRQSCGIRPCQKSCLKKLKCGHRCAGFCGDVCPPFCKICDGGEIGEDAKHTRYIILERCGHVFEMEHIRRSLEEQRHVGLKLCPVCKVALELTHRLI